jgi:hypothetical protein
MAKEKDKKHIFLDDVEWGNKETDSVSHKDMLEINWNKRRNQYSRKKFSVIQREEYNVGTFTLRSPGNDLLDFYDSIMLRQEPTAKSYCAIPPSIIHMVRFHYKYPAWVFDKSNNYGRLSYTRDMLKNYYVTDDHSYFGAVLTKYMKWLKDEPHQSWTFDTYKDLKAFAKNSLKITLQQSINLGGIRNAKSLDKDIVAEEMTWRGKGAGWSVVCNVADDYEYKDSILPLEKYPHKELYQPELEKILQRRKNKCTK